MKSNDVFVNVLCVSFAQRHFPLRQSGWIPGAGYDKSPALNGSGINSEPSEPEPNFTAGLVRFFLLFASSSLHECGQEPKELSVNWVYAADYTYCQAFSK